MQDARLLGSADTGRTAEAMDEAKDAPSAAGDMKSEMECGGPTGATDSEGVVGSRLLGMARRR